MLFFIESVVLCLVFTLMVVPSVYKDPLLWVADYPPKVVQRVKELGLIPESQPHFTPRFLAKKLLATLASVVILALAVFFLNGARTFPQGFLISYGLWLVVDWYDALILDCIWAAHSKKIRVPGTEDMDREYKDYRFHIRMSGIGCLIGLPVCLLVGGLTALMALFF